jgi:hypothetical protein
MRAAQETPKRELMSLGAGLILTFQNSLNPFEQSLADQGRVTAWKRLPGFHHANKSDVERIIKQC